MEFRTEYRSIRSEWTIQHGHSILSAGSCFADCLGKKLYTSQFDVLSNPFGVIFNPLSLIKNLSQLNRTPLEEFQIVERRGQFFYHQLHSQITSPSKDALKKKIAEIWAKVASFLEKTDYLVLTFGTAMVYELKSDKTTVANCHKLPADLFEKRLLSVAEIVHSCATFFEVLQKKNQECKVILTVSPVRHIKDSLTGNNVSKSVLRLACHELSLLYPRLIQYFPAFEIVTDDLRDYRFYKEDLLHPSSQAEEYVWMKFAETYFSKETIELNKEIEELQKALLHMAFNSESVEYKLFLKKLEEKSKKVNAVVPIPRLIEELKLKMKA